MPRTESALEAADERAASNSPQSATHPLTSTSETLWVANWLSPQDAAFPLGPFSSLFCADPHKEHVSVEIAASAVGKTSWLRESQRRAPAEPGRSHWFVDIAGGG